MPVGTLKAIVVCASGSPEALPCPAGTGPSVAQAYVLDASQSSAFEAALAPVNPADAAIFWSAGFVLPLLLYITPRIYAEIIAMVRRGL